MSEVFKFVKRAGCPAIPHPEMDRKALDAAIIILLNCKQIAQAVVGKFVKVKHFQTQLDLINNSAFLRQLLRGSTIRRIKSHMQPRYFMIKRDAIPFVIHNFQTFLAEIRPTVVEMKVLKKYTTIESARTLRARICHRRIDLVYDPCFNVRIMLTANEKHMRRRHFR